MIKSIKTTTKAVDSLQADVLFTGLPLEGKLSKAQKTIDSSLTSGCSLENAKDLADFTGKFGKNMMVFGNSNVKRIHLFGTGDKKKFKTDNVRDLAAKIIKIAKSVKAENIAIDSNSFGLNRDPYCQAFVEGVFLGSYEFNEYKSREKNGEESMEITVTFLGKLSNSVVKKSEALSRAVCFSRDISNHPANVATPSFLANAAKEIGGAKNMEVSILDYKECKKLGMNAFCGVAIGAEEPAKVIIMEYTGGRKKDKPFALVGKGLTFDSGGISLKPGAKMDEMKFDMCGSATVLGVMRTVAELQPKINIVAAIGATENMPGGKAQRPGDIVKAYNGKTIEILNTDAEGRLVLADVLSYVADKYEPTAMMNFATLTGAVLIALGHKAAGVMGNNDSLMKEVKKSSHVTGEKVWELPLWAEYTEDIKSKIADIKNLGAPMQAGTIAAGVFLKEFVGDTPWVHMDIAGTAWGPSKPSYQPSVGATGFGVRLVYDLLEKRAN